MARHTALAQVEDAERVGQIDFGLVEEAVAQTSTNNAAQCAPPEYGVEHLLGEFLSLDELLEVPYAPHHRKCPKQTIVADVE